MQLDSVGVRLLSAASAERLLLRNVTLSVGPRARIAVLGRNGAGKSTLLRAVADGGEGCGWAEVVAGRVVRRRPPSRARAPKPSTSSARTCARPSPRTRPPVSAARCSRLGSCSEASGWADPPWRSSRSARSRAASACGLVLAVEVVAARPHLVVLDEPTNHLDGESLAALVVALNEFEGAVLCVSHHREFVASFATEIWRVEDEGRVASTHVASRVEAEAQLEAYAAQLRGGGAKAEGQKAPTPPPPTAAASRQSEGAESANWRRS